MFRKIKASISYDYVPEIEKFSAKSGSILKLSLRNGPFGFMKPNVSKDERIKRNSLLALADELQLFSPVSGSIKEIKDSYIEILINDDEGVLIEKNSDDARQFLVKNGLIGMGGSGFPASVKFQCGKGKVNTLIVNCTECEPGVSIDRALLLYHSEVIRKGIEFLKNNLQAEKVIITLLKDKNFTIKIKNIYSDYQVTEVGKSYPAGAERLIIRSLTKKDPPQGILPFKLGFHIQNSATLWSLGNALLRGEPAVLRPLTLLIPGKKIIKNLFVANGTSYRDLLDYYYEGEYDQKSIITGGLMMGKEVSLADNISLTTTSVWLLNSDEVFKQSRDCIRCGACFDVCPLNLHPSTVYDKWLNEDKFSASFKTHVKECFLCGSCSAVCPACIPLADVFREAKQCIGK